MQGERQQLWDRDYDDYTERSNPKSLTPSSSSQLSFPALGEAWNLKEFPSKSSLM